MRLADFISSNLEPILAEWESYARTIGEGAHLDKLALRDHAEQILQATALDMKSPQTPEERAEKSKGKESCESEDSLDDASDLHAVDRLGLGFDMLEVISEYRALRASVLRLWHKTAPGSDERDIDDLTRFNESIDQSLSQAVASYSKRVDQARDMFLAILSHDLRNPLNAIAMSSQLLPMLGESKAEIIEVSSTIASSASAMERMINDLLDYTRTRLGAGIPINPTPINLATLGRELISEFRTANPDREIEFHFAGDLNCQLDSDRIRQAISNLMGNAIQYGAANVPVTLSIRGADEDIFIAVHNAGRPILRDELSKIFDPLTRGSSAKNPQGDSPRSIGMGLYIAREVAKSHKGRLDVISTIEAGTSFTIRLPRQTT